MKQLYRASIVLSFFPLILFFYHWFKPAVAVALISTNVAFLGWYLIKCRIDEDLHFSFSDWLKITAIAVGWMLLSGVGGFFDQTPDYIAQYAKMAQLSTHDWPLRNDIDNGYIPYYWGYYLIPTFLMKAFGWSFEWVFVGWNFVLFFLATTWLYYLAERRVASLLLFLSVGSVVLIFPYYVGMLVLQWPVDDFELFLLPQSLFMQSASVPNQLMPILMALGMWTAIERNRKNRYDLLAYPLLLSLFWGVFPVFLLGVIWAGWLLVNKVNLVPILRSPYFVLPLILVASPLLLFYISSKGGGVSGFVWHYLSWEKIQMRFLIFLLPDVSIFLLLIAFSQLPKRTKWFAYALCFSILSLSFFRVGVYDDLFHRGIIPIYAFMLYLLLPYLSFSFRRPVVGLVLVIGMASTFKDIGNKLRHAFSTGSRTVRYNPNMTIYRAFEHNVKEPPLYIQNAKQQYRGDTNSLYFKYLAP